MGLDSHGHEAISFDPDLGVVKAELSLGIEGPTCAVRLHGKGCVVTFNRYKCDGFDTIVMELLD
ncbi:hypothetical protein [Nonomuraea sp. JJY05]|uniref:hypothetical protein n=1 Tax=Nonomuraea sp. JJY05 TaxID=3350255 RepID=UPI00373E67F7